jgi:hypothetical protein
LVQVRVGAAVTYSMRDEGKLDQGDASWRRLARLRASGVRAGLRVARA